jgi:parvulin-like peptidyl-prolyl isomerase
VTMLRSRRAVTCRPRLLPLVLVAALGVALAACSGGVGTAFAPVAAVVGGTQISEADVNAQVLLNGSQFGNLFQGPESNLVRLSAKQQMLGVLIQQVALAHEAARMGVAVTPTAVSGALARIRGQYATDAAFQTALADAGLSLHDLAYAEQLTLTVSNLSHAVTAGINATPAQIAAAYQQNQATYASEYDAAQILICGHQDKSTGACTTTPADLALAQQVDQKALGGEDFAQLAATYSDDTATKYRGGDLGWQAPGALIPAFEQAATALAPGQITPQPVQTQFGYSIIKLLAKGETLADATPSINQSLEQTARTQALDAFLARVIAGTTITVNPAFGSYDRRNLAVVAPPGAVPSPAPGGTGQGGP